MALVFEAAGRRGSCTSVGSTEWVDRSEFPTSLHFPSTPAARLLRTRCHRLVPFAGPRERCCGAVLPGASGAVAVGRLRPAKTTGGASHAPLVRPGRNVLLSILALPYSAHLQHPIRSPVGGSGHRRRPPHPPWWRPSPHVHSHVQPSLTVDPCVWISPLTWRTLLRSIVRHIHRSAPIRMTTSAHRSALAHAQRDTATERECL